MELERSLDAGCEIIVIEPTQLGDETARWISVGNYLHKSAVVSGFGAIVAGLVWPENPLICTPLGAFSLLCTGLYTVSWQFDNCVKYQVGFPCIFSDLLQIDPAFQVETDPHKLARLPLVSAMAASSPVVLVRKDDTRRKILHCSVSLAASALCAYRLYCSLK